ncbi:U32 family peptidase [Peptoniphilus catoniae]|uniref:U32 family peptidase n=1 Tax=Peptoniphilus catoniae TaxID=1660341 RepID=UPI0010FD7037|nr:U32 family peptidase [Peptoniphilus catoniae]
MRNKAEILAPAGSFESLEAAIKAGANSVYLGGKQFSARSGANNFTDEELIKAVEYAHLREVKVFVVVNILIDNSEMMDALDFCDFLYEIGVDAIITQDLGLSSLLVKRYPDMEIHASTQMAVNNFYGALTFENMGFKRLVIARETELSEISAIKEKTSMDLEAFIHGALCVCFSGECLMSSMIGARSGNRGNCAQPCRKFYKILDLNFKDLGKKGYLISPKDLNTLDRVSDLVDLGVDSLKIEGRLKKPEYVYQITKSYRRALEDKLTNKDLKDTRQIFNRDFTQGLSFGDFGRNFVSGKRPDNRGILIGEVIEPVKGGFYVSINEPIYSGDGLEFYDERGSEGFKADFSTDPKERFFIKSARPIRKGQKIFKTFSKKLEDEIHDDLNRRQSYRSINMYCKIRLGQKALLRVSSQGLEVEAQSEVVAQRAINKSLDYNLLYKSLSKLGDSIYKLDNFQADIDDEVFLTMATLNKLRRDAIDKLNNKIIKRDRKDKVNLIYRFTEDVHYEAKEPELKVEVNNFDNLRKLEGENCKIYYPIDCIDNEVVSYLLKSGIKVSAVFKKYQNSKSLEQSIELLNKNREIVDEIIINNLSQISALENIKIPKVADIGLNIFNSKGVEFLIKKGFKRVILSPELNESQIKDIAKDYGDFLELVSHGLLPVMTMVHCPMSTELNCKNSLNCYKCKFSKGFYLEDSFKERFLVERRDGISEIFNSHPLMFSKKVLDLKKMGVRSFKLNLRNNIKETIKLYENILDGKNPDDTYIKKCLTENYGLVTYGHLNRGVI